MEDIDILSNCEYENWLRIHLPEFANAAAHFNRLRALQPEERRSHLAPMADFDALMTDPAFRPRWVSAGEDTH